MTHTLPRAHRTEFIIVISTVGNYTAACPRSEVLTIFKYVVEISILSTYKQFRRTHFEFPEEIFARNYVDIAMCCLYLRVRESASVSIGCRPLYCGRIKSTNPNLTLIFRPYRLRSAINDLYRGDTLEAQSNSMILLCHKIRLIINTLKRISLILLQVIIFTSPQIASPLYLL